MKATSTEIFVFSHSWHYVGTCTNVFRVELPDAKLNEWMNEIGWPKPMCEWMCGPWHHLLARWLVCSVYTSPIVVEYSSVHFICAFCVLYYIYNTCNVCARSVSVYFVNFWSKISIAGKVFIWNGFHMPSDDALFVFACKAKLFHPDSHFLISRFPAFNVLCLINMPWTHYDNNCLFKLMNLISWRHITLM